MKTITKMQAVVEGLQQIPFKKGKDLTEGASVLKLAG